MSSTRRIFLKQSAAATSGIALAGAAQAVIPTPAYALLGRKAEPVPGIQDPRLKELIQRGIGAAQSAGASYSDMRLTHTRVRKIGFMITESESLNVGVRALVDGYWGFASGPSWSMDEVTRLGREAVNQAKTNSLGKPRTVELAPVVKVSDGHWTMPVKYDPFEIHPHEIMDHLGGHSEYVKTHNDIYIVQNECEFTRQDKAFGATNGSYFTQRTYRTWGGFGLQILLPKDGKSGAGELDMLSPAGAGWELYRDQPIREFVRKLIEEIYEDMSIPPKAVDVGRYNVVFDAQSIAALISPTIGAATELDRAMGYEANSVGTSYLNEPAEMMGTFKIGSPLLNVSANRTDVGGAATVGWDDEGVVPHNFTLVKEGVLEDYQTTRESVMWLKNSYDRMQRPLQSHGCALGGALAKQVIPPPPGLGMYAPLTHTPNLVLAPGTEKKSFDDLVSGMDTGLVFTRMKNVNMDFQQSGGLAIPGKAAYEYKNGKRIARVGAGMLFRSSEFWKQVAVLGGVNSARTFGFEQRKGEPEQSSIHSVTAVPAMVKDITIIDPWRKA